jgi:hypothetical protein
MPSIRMPRSLLFRNRASARDFTMTAIA